MNLQTLSKKDLYKLAKEKLIPNRSKMTKAQLVSALESLLIQPEEAIDKTVDQPGYPPADESPVSQHVETDYEIPEKYNRDTIYLMPVNPSKEYTYWEVSDSTEKKYVQELGLESFHYVLKLFHKTGYGIVEVCSASVDKIGNYYFHEQLSNQHAWVEIGIDDHSGHYYPVITSKRVKIPDNKLSDITDAEFMTIGENSAKLYELSGYGEFDTNGSFKFHKELSSEILKGLSSFNSE